MGRLHLPGLCSLHTWAASGVCAGLQVPPLDDQRSLPNKLLGLVSGVGVSGFNLSSGYSVFPARGQRLGEVSPEMSFQRAHLPSPICISFLTVWMLGLDSSTKPLLMGLPLYVSKCVEISGTFPVGDTASLC